MASPAPTLSFDTAFDPQTGRPVQVAPDLVRVTAPNASPYTFTGTNSFLIGQERLALVDPGPADSLHLAALRQAIDGRRVDAIILTHTHKDHSDAAAQLARELGAPLWFGGRHRLSRPLRRFERNPIRNSCDWHLVPDRVLVDGDRLMVDKTRLEVIATPGHCANHLAFGLVGTPILLTGDHVMGWNSTLVSVPDGSMADYFASLGRVLASGYRYYVPAHGGPIADGPAYGKALEAHRRQRNSQIIAAVSAGAHSVPAITGKLYPDVPLAIKVAARMTVMAHIEYLESSGALRVSRRPWGLRVAL
ncbi:MBL fold metallo-hydrolase [Devosia algicola]|uniref:MBL fold metallo-hydrolase n=1 Tax=Devosia algicola TaxID=3026418 RepID=A0ABY7YNU1_9HYPH|nr:MBL fold metallo-hydrolase [Devosia algicola]WDR02565.1 MBL fold metallo-hydrolase [Devosia algicola]